MLLFFITIPASIAAIAATIAVVLPIFTFIYYSVTFSGWVWKLGNWIKKKFGTISEEEKQVAEFYRESKDKVGNIAQYFYDKANNSMLAKYPSLLGTAKGDLLIVKSRIIESFKGNKEGKKLYLAIKNLYSSIEDKNEREKKEQEAYKRIAYWFTVAKDDGGIIFYLQYAIACNIDINELSFSSEKFRKFNAIYNKGNEQDNGNGLDRVVCARRFFKLVTVLGIDFVDKLQDGLLAKFITSEDSFRKFEDTFNSQLMQNKKKFNCENEEERKRSVVTATSNSMRFWLLYHYDIKHEKYGNYEADKMYDQVIELLSMSGDKSLVSIKLEQINYSIVEHPFFFRSILDSERTRLHFLKADEEDINEEENTTGNKHKKYEFELVDKDKFIKDLGTSNGKFAETQNVTDMTLKYHVIHSIGDGKATRNTKRCYLMLKKLPEEQKQNICICFSRFPETTRMICQNFNKSGGPEKSFELFAPQRMNDFNKIYSGHCNTDDVNIALRLWRCIDLFGFEFVNKFHEDVISVIKNKRLWNRFCAIQKETENAHFAICPSAYRHELRFWLLFLKNDNGDFEVARRITTKIFSEANPHLFNKVKYDDLKSMADDFDKWKDIKGKIFVHDAKRNGVSFVSKKRQRRASCSDLPKVTEVKGDLNIGEVNI